MVYPQVPWENIPLYWPEVEIKPIFHQTTTTNISIVLCIELNFANNQINSNFKIPFGTLFSPTCNQVQVQPVHSENNSIKAYKGCQQVKLIPKKCNFTVKIKFSF